MFTHCVCGRTRMPAQVFLMPKRRLLPLSGGSGMRVWIQKLQAPLCISRFSICWCISHALATLQGLWDTSNEHRQRCDLREIIYWRKQMAIEICGRVFAKMIRKIPSILLVLWNVTATPLPSRNGVFLLPCTLGCSCELLWPTDDGRSEVVWLPVLTPKRSWSFCSFSPLWSQPLCEEGQPLHLRETQTAPGYPSPHRWGRKCEQPILDPWTSVRLPQATPLVARSCPCWDWPDLQNRDKK